MKHPALRGVFLVSSFLLVLSLSPSAFAQTITVTSANPNNAPQGTVHLNVLIGGKGFKNGARAVFYLTGTTNPAGITVNSTAFNGATQVTANINVADTASISGYDIVVQNTDGRSGKGTQLFAVTANGSKPTACPSVPPMLVATNNCTLAFSGCLDTTFGGGGMVLTDTTGGWDYKTDLDQARILLVQPDGKIVAVGDSKNTGSTPKVDFILVRYNNDGSLDTSFGNAGIVRDAITTGDDEPYAAALQPDGKILVGGYGGSGNYMAAARFNPDGTLDPTFGNGGNVLISFLTHPKTGVTAYALALQGDGKILLGGSGPNYWIIVRLKTNGTVDTSFANQGSVALNLNGTVLGLTTQMISTGIVKEERILAAGGSQIIRLTSTGSLDKTFGPNLDGTLSTTCNAPWSIAVDEVNRIVVAGSVPDPGDDSYLNFALSRFTPNGIADTSFGDPVSGSSQRSGFTTVDFFAANDRVRGLAIQSDGRLLVSGSAEGPNVATIYQVYFALARFNPDGTLDGTFGTGGVVATDYGSPAAHDAGWGVALQDDGKIVMAGYAAANGTYNFAVARYLP